MRNRPRQSQGADLLIGPTLLFHPPCDCFAGVPGSFGFVQSKQQLNGETKRGNEWPFSHERDMYLKHQRKTHFELLSSCGHSYPSGLLKQAVLFSVVAFHPGGVNAKKSSSYCLLETVQKKNIKYEKRTHVGGKLQRKKPFDDSVGPVNTNNISVDKIKKLYHLNAVLEQK